VREVAVLLGVYAAVAVLIYGVGCYAGSRHPGKLNSQVLALVALSWPATAMWIATNWAEFKEMVKRDLR